MTRPMPEPSCIEINGSTGTWIACYICGCEDAGLTIEGNTVVYDCPTHMRVHLRQGIVVWAESRGVRN